MREIPARYFDGKRAECVPVMLQIRDGHLLLRKSTGEEISLAFDALRVTLLSSLIPPVIELDGGARLQLPESEESRTFAREVQNRQKTGAAKKSPMLLFGALCAGGLLLIVAVLSLSPTAETQLAALVPASALQSLGTQQLSKLDDGITQPSELPPDRQTAIAEQYRRFAALVEPGVSTRVVFRKGGQAVGPNAFACADGTIVLLDSLVDAAGTDDAVLAVLGHELGHIALRHAARRMFEESLLRGALTFWFGEISSSALRAPEALFKLRYSREHEREADRYAVAVLQKAGISTATMEELLRNILAKNGADGRFASFLSTHPSFTERMAIARQRQELPSKENR